MAAPENLKSMNIYQRINHIMNVIDGIAKGKFVSTGGQGGYKAVTHDDVTALLHQPFADMGIVVLSHMTNSKTEMFLDANQKQKFRADVWVDVRYVNMDDPKDFFMTSSYAYSFDSSDKATGKAFSMAVKYAHLKNLMLESYDDEENRNYERENDYKNDNRNNSANTIGNNADQKKEQYGNVKSNEVDKKSGSEKFNKATKAQIGAIKKICESKKINIDKKFGSEETCSFDEASNEIKRLSSTKAN